MNNKILENLDLFRKIKARDDFKVSILRIHIISVLLFFILIIIESLFYLQPENRYPVVLYCMSIYSSMIIYAVLKYFFHYNNFFNNSSNESISRLIGDNFLNIKDKLINAYQLENKLDKNNKVEYELSIYAINQIKKELNLLAVSFNRNKIKILLNRLYFSLSIFIIILFNDHTFSGINRLLNPQKVFDISLPFELLNITEDSLTFDGKNKKVSIAAIGEIPDSIILNYIIDEKINSIKINHIDEVFNYTFRNVQSDITWWANLYSNSIFSSWDNIKSKVDTITVIKRPIISNLDFRIIPPSYTKLSSYNHPPNISSINFPAGSNIIINGSSNKSLNNAKLITDHDTLFLKVNQNNFFGELTLMESSKGIITCADNIFNQESNPITYTFNADYDSYPTLSVIQPELEFELDESNIINLNIQVSDDYGISKVWVDYMIIRPSYIQFVDTNKYTYELSQFNKDVKVQSINDFWNIQNIKLSPEDEIHFTINVSDNNIFSPNITKSKKIIGRYPTIEDLFKQMENYEEDVNQHNEELVSNIDEVQDMVNEIKLDLLKSNELSWEDKQELDKTIGEMENVFSEIENIQEAIQKIEDEAEKNNLISDELIQKYDQFQDLLTQIITPDLLEAIEKIQNLTQEMNLDELLNELNNFEESLNEFEEQIDRFIDMFEQAIAEQKIDEIIKKLESMLNQQTEISDQLNKEDISFKDLSSKERRIEEEYKNLQDVLEDAMESSEKSSKSTSDMINKLINSQLNQETNKKIKEARESLAKEDKEKSKENSEKSNENLSEMLEKSQEIQKNFQNETVNEMINEFISVVNSILNISKYQDELSSFSNGIRSNSPILPTIAKKQNRIRLQNQQLMKQILDLSRKTFYITPPIIRALGQSSLAMDKSISHLEQKKTSPALKEQSKIIDGLNETAYLLLDAMENMRSSGSASGFESFMDQLGELSDKQKGINESTMQLPQLGSNGQQSMMQQLMNQQQALKEGLEQLLSNMPGAENTGLGQANKEMEEVINDFKREQVDRKTKERQQRILSRMLDSQKSLTKKDFSNNRKSESNTENIIYDSPSGLPENKGQRDLLLINAMERALQEGHPNEYQELIKLYFYNLQKDVND